ncbi:MAG: hypothetical protein IT289_00965 [Oligoflexia bacterium]|nr:hypothetical protein [Oligoflexia bacterium]
MAHFEFSSLIKAPKHKVFEVLSNPEHFPKLVGSFLIKWEERPHAMKPGTKYRFRVSKFGVSMLWEHQVDEFREDSFFKSHQIIGPFSYWIHTRKLEDHGDETLLTEFIEYDLPLGILGKLAEDLIMQGELEKSFQSRHEMIKNLSN